VDSPPVLSPDGRRFTCTIPNSRGIDEVWISPIDHPEFRRLGTDPNADCFSPTWSPDGASIAYVRFGKDDRDGVYVQDAEGGEARRVLAPESEVRYHPGAWLPDGSALLAMRAPAGKPSIVLVPLDGGETDSSRVRPLLPDDFARWFPKLSRDGRLLAFGSAETGKPQVWVAEMRPGGGVGRPIQVKTSGSIFHAWGPDGKTLFIQDARNRLMKVSVSLGPPLSVSAPVEVADLEKLRVAQWSVLPDGRFFVGLKNENEDEITRYDLVQNWTELLKRKLRAAH
jgi:Tol biopolymer transport system component